MSENNQQSRNRSRLIAYWVVTILFCLPMGAGGVFDFLRTPDVLETFTHLGYPDYFAVMLGVAKVLGVIAVLAPGTPRLKEWAYAGFTFDLGAAAISHFTVGDPIGRVALPLAFLVIGAASYWLRPASRQPGPASDSDS